MQTKISTNWAEFTDCDKKHPPIQFRVTVEVAHEDPLVANAATQDHGLVWELLEKAAEAWNAYLDREGYDSREEDEAEGRFNCA